MTSGKPQTEDSGGGLSGRVVKGAGWMFATRISKRGLQFAKYLILARLLTPEDLGLFALVTLTIITLRTVSYTGFDEALIQRRDNAEDYLDTAWTVQLLRSLFLGCALYGLSPAIAWFFGEPLVVPMLQVMSAAVLVEGLRNIGVVFFRKHLQFHRQFVLEAVPAAVSLAVGVVLAYRLRSVWALVWARLAEIVLMVLLSYLLHSFRPNLRWAPAQAAELFRFGGWILISSVLILVARQGDDVFLGKYLGAAALGIYQIAYRLSNIPATELTHTVSRVTFPAYSLLQENLERFRNGYRRVLQVTMFWATPISLGIALTAPTFVPVILGEKWLAAVLPTQILCLFGWLRSYAASVGPVTYASGRPDLQVRCTVFQLVVMGASIWPLTKAYGIPGTCLSTTLGILASAAYASICLRKILHLSELEVLKKAGRPVMAALGMVPAVYFLKTALGTTILSMLLQVLAGASVYFLLSALVQRDQLREMMTILKNLRRPQPASKPGEAPQD